MAYKAIGKASELARGNHGNLAMGHPWHQSTVLKLELIPTNSCPQERVDGGKSESEWW